MIIIIGCSTKIPPWMQTSLSRNGRSGFNDSEERIVGGFKALEPIPWQAHITIMVGSKSNQCGGTILDEETILTAAHCLKFNPLGPIKVETGIIDNPLLKRNFVINEKDSNVKEVLIHPDFENVEKGDDIAILKLKTPLTFDNDTNSACLPEPTFSPEDKELGFVSGWGRYSTRSLVSDTLRYVPIPLVKNTDCVSWAPQYESILKDTMVCAGTPAGGVDSCKGDSGGPLVVGGAYSSIEEEDYGFDELGFERASSATDYAIIYGIVSFGPKLCGRPKVTGVYTRVTKYLTWISSHMKVKSTPITPTTQFQCRDYSIPIQFKCDGLVQCVPDGSDEIDCPTKSTNKSSKDQSEQALKMISRQICSSWIAATTCIS
jgi:secreted trypsin-like serine protease